MFSGLWGCWVPGRGSEGTLLGAGRRAHQDVPLDSLDLLECTGGRGNILPVCIKAPWVLEGAPARAATPELGKHTNATPINPSCLPGKRLTARGCWSFLVTLYVSLLSVSLPLFNLPLLLSSSVLRPVGALGISFPLFLGCSSSRCCKCYTESNPKDYLVHCTLVYNNAAKQYFTEM